MLIVEPFRINLSLLSPTLPEALPLNAEGQGSPSVNLTEWLAQA
jgi:hypothetical protein